MGERTSRESRNWRWRDGIVSAVLVSAIAIGIESLGGFQLLEWAALDRLFHLRPTEPVDDRVVLVTVNETDLRAFGRWPVPDGVLAETVENIAADDPAAIGVNLYRDLPVEPGRDEWVRIAQNTPNLIGVEKIVGDPVAPPAVLKQDDRVGFADFVLDGDGKVRRALLSHPDASGVLQQSFAVRLSLLYLKRTEIASETFEGEPSHLHIGQTVFHPLHGSESGYANANAAGYQILLNYRGRSDRFPQLSIRQVLAGEFAPGTFRDRVVLIGSTATSLNNTIYTPYSGGWLTTPRGSPQVVVQANIVSQILSAALDGRPLLMAIPPWLEWGWTLLWGSVGAMTGWLAARRLRRRKPTAPPVRWVVLVGGLLLATAGLGAVVVAAFGSGLWLPVVAPATALWTVTLLVTTQRLRDNQQDSDRRLLQFLEALPVGITVLDADGHLYYSNHTAREILGDHLLPGALDENRTAPETYISQTELPYPPDQLPAVRALQGATSTANVLDVRLDDETVPLEMWGSPIFDREGRVSFAVVAFQDIGIRQKAEAERERATRELFESNRNLDRALAAEQDLTDAAARFVPHEFLSFLGYESLVDVQLGKAVEKEMSVLFSDIRNFTTLSEQMSLEDNFKFINAYLSRMEPAISENQGFIDKYIGDAIMALFGESADDAVKAGIAMLEKLAEYNTTRSRPDRPPLRIGIGINTGSLMLGTVGGLHHMDSTVISDAVNLAARIEELTKVYGVPLLISHSTFLQLEDTNRYAIRLIDRVRVKGKSQQVSVFEVFDADPPELKAAKLNQRTDFEQAVMQYHLKSYREAAGLFGYCLEHNRNDLASQIYLERCQSHLDVNGDFEPNCRPMSP
ncbi:CHASE2 domain-containing protein [Baaleninema sp.]|uniref:CHASE2 domain-containing protein n=1 Tax=Baaleninema sp. TaxID=3101197 RepID=UPI003D07D9A0